MSYPPNSPHTAEESSLYMTTTLGAATFERNANSSELEHATLADVISERDYPADNGLLEACLSLAESASLVELERRLDYWLTRLYAPLTWSLVYPHGDDEPLIKMQSSTRKLLTKDHRTDKVVQAPLIADQRIVGQLDLEFAHSRVLGSREQLGLHRLARVLVNRLSRVHLELQSLAQTAELLFMQSLVRGDIMPGENRDLDKLAANLLNQLDVSSFQILINRLGFGGITWGISSRRVDLTLSVERQQRLLEFANSVCQTSQADRPYLLAQHAEIRKLAETYDLPHLGQFQLLLVVPIRSNTAFLGAVILGEERSPARQPLSPQALSFCTLLSQLVATSITQSRLVEEMIERGRAMQALVDGLDTAVFTAKQGSIVSWNRAAQQLLGYTDAEVLGKALTDVLPSAPPELSDSVQLPGHPDDPKLTREWKMSTADGRGLYLSCTVSALAPEAGPPALMYVLRDIGQAQELEYLKNELLFSVSHELRTPLNGIYGFSRLLLDRPHMPEEMRREALESLQGSIERLTRLADDFIDVARARRHRLPLQLDAIDIAEVIRASVRELRQRHLDHTIVVRIRRDLSLVHGDSLRIKQIIDNLVGNATKYAAEGTQILINVRQRNGMVVISVTDQGVGIPKAVQSRVFEPFYRADNSRNQRASGVGLGLSIVKSLVQAHGGEVRVRSLLGRGSTFTFTLPIVSGD